MNNLKPINVSFKKDEYEIYVYLLNQGGVSYYLKNLIRKDMEEKKKKEEFQTTNFNNNLNNNTGGSFTF